MSPRLRSSQRGFTLIELLTAVVITSIIMTLLLGLMTQSSDTYRTAQSSVSSLSESRAFFQFLQTDLASRLPNTPFMAEITANSDSIAFVRARSYDEQTSMTEGDLQTSVYYVAFTSDSNGAVSPKLFRRSLNAVDTQTLLEGAPNPSVPPGQPNVDEPVVYNVIRFKAQPKFYTSTGALQNWTQGSSNQPALVEITMELTDDTTAARFKSESSWNTLRTSTDRKVRETVRTYTRIIPLAQ